MHKEVIDELKKEHSASSCLFKSNFHACGLAKPLLHEIFFYRGNILIIT